MKTAAHINVYPKILACAMAILFGSASAQDQPLISGTQFPPGFGVLRSSLSPDKRFGILAGADAEHCEDHKLVVVKTGQVVATINAEPGFIDMSHGGMHSRWAEDGSLLLWEVRG